MKISIVIQGQIIRQDDTTINCCKSIRKHFPYAEMILSTWHGQDVSGLDVDKIIFTHDPGPGYMNLRRQVVSSYRGVCEASYNIVMKVRTDCIFTSNCVIDHYSQYPNRVDRLKVFNERIIVPNMQTIDPENNSRHKIWRRCFNASDWMCLGQKADLKHLYNLPIEATNNHKVSPEQTLWVHAIWRKYPEIKLSRVTAMSPTLVGQSSLFFANNLVVLNTKSMFGACVHKYLFQEDTWPQYMTYEKWVGHYDNLQKLSEL